MSEATIASPELTLAEGVSLGATGANLETNKEVLGSATVEIANSGNFIHMDRDGAFLMDAQGNLLLAMEQGQSYNEFYSNVVNVLKEQNPDNPEIQALTAESVAETVKEGIIKKKAIEAVSMVCAYTNGSDSLEGKHFDLNAMYAAAENVINEAKNYDHPEDLLRINPMEHAVQAIADNCAPYKDQQSISSDDLHDIEAKISEHISYDEYGNVNFKPIMSLAEGTISRVVDEKMAEHFPNKKVPQIQIPDFMPDISMDASLVSNAINVKAPSPSKGAALA